MTDPLLALQDLDLTISRAQARTAALESGDAQRAGAFLLRDDENRLGELRLEFDALASQQKRMEYDIDALSQKAAAEEKRMYDGSVANAKELESMRHEVDNIRSRRSRFEDELLEMMERREELEARIAEAESAVAADRTRLETLERDAETELAELATTLSTAREQRAATAATIDPDVLELYEDLRAQKKGVGAAALVDGVCQGCHEKLSAVELDRLRKAEGVTRCDYCRRILVL